MAISKIKSIQGSGTFDFNGSTLFKNEVELEDGTVGQVNTQTPDKWKAGNEVEYTVTRDDPKYGKTLKFQSPGQQNKGGFTPRQADPKADHNRQVMIMLQSNMKIAFDLCNNFDADSRMNVTGDTIFTEAERLTELMLNSRLLDK